MLSKWRSLKAAAEKAKAAHESGPEAFKRACAGKGVTEADIPRLIYKHYTVALVYRGVALLFLMAMVRMLFDAKDMFSAVVIIGGCGLLGLVFIAASVQRSYWQWKLEQRRLDSFLSFAKAVGGFFGLLAVAVTGL